MLALACDRVVECGEDVEFADVLVGDLTARATVDEAGVRWSNYEHRATPPGLDPRTGWAMGNAGTVRELLRYARLIDGGFAGYAIQWPNQPVALAGPTRYMTRAEGLIGSCALLLASFVRSKSGKNYITPLVTT